MHGQGENSIPSQTQFNSKKVAKIRNQYNKLLHLTQDTIWDSEKTQGNITHKRDKRSALSQKVITGMQGTENTVYKRQT